jgi:hypothetical protein
MKKTIIRFLLTGALFTPHLNATANSILDIEDAIVASGNIQSTLLESLGDMQKRAQNLNRVINAPSREDPSLTLLNLTEEEGEEELRSTFQRVSDVKRDLFEISRT